MRRLRECVERWPAAYSGGYDPRCCRFPKSCSASIYADGVAEELLEAPSDLVGAAAQSRANVILTFRDETGREWVAAAEVGPLLAEDDTAMHITDTLDRVLTLHDIRVIVR